MKSCACTLITSLLQTFFEGIQSRVASGVKEEEVGYALAFSKQELRKVIKEYPGKEVLKSMLLLSHAHV